MAGNAEFLIVCRFDGGIETAPEDDARDNAQYKNCKHRMLRVWLNKETPGALQDACITNHQKSLCKNIKFLDLSQMRITDLSKIHYSKFVNYRHSGEGRNPVKKQTPATRDKS
jgi:hypothetical protein